MKTYAINLIQTRKNGNLATNFKFQVKTEDISEAVDVLANKLFKIWDIQKQIYTNKGKANLFGIVKSGDWFVDIDVIEEGERSTVISQMEFTFSKLGEENPKENLKLISEAWFTINN
jgi:hypothetical protein